MPINTHDVYYLNYVALNSKLQSIRKNVQFEFVSVIATETEYFTSEFLYKRRTVFCHETGFALEGSIC